MQKWILHAAATTKMKEAEAGRRKFPSVGVSVVMRWFGRWLRGRQLRLRWPESAVGGKKNKLQRREKCLKEKRERVAVASLPLVRIWVDGNDGGKASCGGGGRWKRKQKKKKIGGAAKRREKGSRWLSVVIWWLPVMQLMVETPLMRVVVAEGHGGERKKRKDRLQENWAEKAGLWWFLDLMFSSSRPSHLPLFIGGRRG